MKRFIFNIFILFIIIFVFNIIVFVFANDNYYKGYNDFPDKRFRSFIMADSHGMSIKKMPEKFGVYNFSDNSDSYYDMKRKLIYLIENHYKIDKIYISVDNYTLSPYRDKNNNLDKSIKYTSKIDYNYINEKYIKYYFPIFQPKINSLFRIYLQDKVKLIFQQRNNTVNIIWNKLSEEEKIVRAKDRVNSQFPSHNKSKALEQELIKIIDICQRNNIKLIGVKFPVSGYYLKMLGNKNYGADKLFVSKGLEIIDCQSFFKEKNEYFGDQDHLNFQGGEKFTKILLQK